MPPRNVVVTGGGKGIGRAIALRLAVRGDRVVICGRDQAALAATVEAAPGTATVEARVLDVTDENAVGAVFDGIGIVDVLVNNAGIAHAAPLATHSLADWSRLLRVNATGAFLCTRAVFPGMRERDRGRIVIVASTAGRVGYRYTAGYTASKHAVVGLMRAVAAECAGSGVTANAVCPHYVKTEMTERTIANIVDRTGRTEQDALAELEKMSPLGRLLDPGEVAAAVEFLASDAAAAINGQTVVLDGGGIQS